MLSLRQATFTALDLRGNAHPRTGTVIRIALITAELLHSGPRYSPVVIMRPAS